jgi:ferritin-like metal-binding protein YciE
MKTINTLEDALTMELENLYCGEEKLRDSFSKIEKIIHSDELRNIIYRYTESCDEKRMKIYRVFAYLNHEPHLSSAHVIDELIDESIKRLKFAQDPDVQEQILINCLERINAYKTCTYEASLRYAEELELDNAADQLLSIIQEERKTKRQLVDLSVHLFNTKDYVA